MIDIIFLILILMAIYKGYRKGLIISLFSIIALMVGLAAAMKLSAMAAGYLEGSLNVSARGLAVLSFVLVFLLAVFIVRLGAKAIEKTVELAMLGWANRIAGIILYFILYTCVFSVILFYAVKIGLLSAQTLADSSSYSFIKPWGPAAINALGVILPFFKNMFAELESFFGRVKS